MSARYYSELWCGGEVAQMQSIQQTGFLGIRQGEKKKMFVRLVDCAVFSLSDFCWVTHKHICRKACGTVHSSSRLRQTTSFSLSFILSNCSLSFDKLWGEGGKCYVPPPQPPQWDRKNPQVVMALHPTYIALSRCWPSSSSPHRLEQIINPPALIVWVLRDLSQREARTVLQSFGQALHGKLGL